MTTRAIVVTAAAVAAAVLPFRSGAARAAPNRPLTVQAAFTPRVVEFGDTVTAQIVVTMDAHALQPSSLHVVYGVAPLTQLGAPIVRHVTRGGLSVATYQQHAACLSDSCIAASGSRTITPGAVRLDVARRAGAPMHATTAWAPLAVMGRVTAADLKPATPPFRADITPPAPSYRVRPSRLAALLDAAAALLAACGAGLAAAALLRSRRPSRTQHTDELTRALLLARAARTRPEPDRRAAIGYVARLLARREPGLAHAADDLAWSRPAPAPDSLTELVEDVERQRST